MSAGADSTMMQFGGAFALLQNIGQAGPSSEKSHSSQVTPSSHFTPSPSPPRGVSPSAPFPCGNTCWRFQFCQELLQVFVCLLATYVSANFV